MRRILAVIVAAQLLLAPSAESQSLITQTTRLADMFDAALPGVERQLATCQQPQIFTQRGQDAVVAAKRYVATIRNKLAEIRGGDSGAVSEMPTLMRSLADQIDAIKQSVALCD